MNVEARPSGEMPEKDISEWELAQNTLKMIEYLLSEIEKGDRVDLAKPAFGDKLVNWRDLLEPDVALLKQNIGSLNPEDRKRADDAIISADIYLAHYKGTHEKEE